MNDKFEKFTERARKVLSLAQDAAQRFNHNYIGTEHLLLGLVREGDGVAAKVLANLGVELQKVRSAVEFIIGRGDRIVLGEIGLTPRAKKVIELAVDEARRLNHHYIGTEHLLLGLVREGEGIAAGVLESLGVNLERARVATIQTLAGGGGAAYAGTSSAPGDADGVGAAHMTLGSYGPRRARHRSNILQGILLVCSALLLGVGVIESANGIAYGLAGSVGLAISVATTILGVFAVVQVIGLMLASRDRVVGYALVGFTALVWTVAMALERANVVAPLPTYWDTAFAQSLNWAVLGLGALVVIMTIIMSLFGSVWPRRGHR